MEGGFLGGFVFLGFFVFVFKDALALCKRKGSCSGKEKSETGCLRIMKLKASTFSLISNTISLVSLIHLHHLNKFLLDNIFLGSLFGQISSLFNLYNN